MYHQKQAVQHDIDKSHITQSANIKAELIIVNSHTSLGREPDKSGLSNIIKPRSLPKSPNSVGTVPVI